MQSNLSKERELVKLCMAELCKEAGFADSENMIQRDLEFLSESILAKTGVLISLSTIKRLFNEEFSRLPQIATLNAIAMFLGYQNWQGYKLKKCEPLIIQDKPREQIPISLSAHPNKFSYTRFLLLGGFLSVVTLGLLAMLKLGKPGLSNFGKAQFSADKVTRNDLPNTVVFKYNIDEVTADSFFIQQSWDKNRRVRIYKNNYTLTDIYFEPGYHTAKLIANDQIIKTLDVSIPTDGWLFYAKEKTPLSKPIYIHSAKGFKSGPIKFQHDDLLHTQVEMKKENEYVQVYFPTKIESSSDNFILKYRIRVTVLNNDFCPYFMGEIFCQKNFMFFTSTPKGCTSEVHAQFGEKYISGKTNDLSALGADVKSWQNVEVIVRNKQAHIRINNEVVFATNYQQSGGLITGLGFISNGIAEVDSVDLKTIEGKTIYSKSE